MLYIPILTVEVKTLEAVKLDNHIQRIIIDDLNNKAVGVIVRWGS